MAYRATSTPRPRLACPCSSGGVIWMTAVILWARAGHVNEKNSLPVEMVGLYWHFVDLVWVVLFTVIYLI